MRTKLLGSEKWFYFLLITVMVFVMIFVFCPSVQAQLAVAEDSVVSTEQIIGENVTPGAQEQLQSEANEDSEQSILAKHPIIGGYLIFISSFIWAFIDVCVLGELSAQLLGAKTRSEKRFYRLVVAFIFLTGVVWLLVSKFDRNVGFLFGGFSLAGFLLFSDGCSDDDNDEKTAK